MSSASNPRVTTTPAAPTFVLERLSGVTPSARGFMARCPAHPDQTPSLEVWRADSGGIGVNCYAGCTRDDVLRALNLSWKDLTPPHPKHGQTAAVYDYVDADGALRFQVVRREPKDFRQRAPDPRAADGFADGLNGATPVLYRLPRVLDAVKRGHTVYVCEGEKDVHALEQAGAVATCNPMGAGKGKWRDEFSEALRGADVVLVQDNDEPGRRHAREVRASLLKVGARVRVAQARAGKDAADHLAAGHGLEAFVDAPVVDVPDFILEYLAADGSAPVATDLDRPLYRTLADVLQNPDAFKPPPVVIPRLAWAGRVSMLAAREKLGKSTLVTAGAAAVTSGAAFLGDMPRQGKVLWVLAEEHPGDLARRALRFGVVPERLVLLERLEEPLANLVTAAREVQPVLVVVDTLYSFASSMVKDANAAAQWAPILSTFTSVARETGAAVLVLHHASKANGKYRDSTAIGGGVDAILEMDAKENEPGPQRRIACKGRWEMRDYTVSLTERGYELGDGKSLEERILAALEDNPQGSSLRALIEALSIGQTTAQKAIKELLERNVIAQTGGGRNSKYVLMRDSEGRQPF